MSVHARTRGQVHVCLNRKGSSTVCFGGLNIPHLLRREGGIKDEGTEKSMAEWNPAVIERFQLTLAEEKKKGGGGIPKHSAPARPARSPARPVSRTLPPACLPARLPHSFFLARMKLRHFYCLFSLISPAFVSFSISLYPEVARRFLFMKLCLVCFFSSP